MPGSGRAYNLLMGSMTRSRTRLLGTIGLAMSSLVVVPGSARAVDCEWFSQTLVPNSGEVPASLSSILWTASPSSAQIADPSSVVSFTRIDERGASTSVPFRIVSTRLGNEEVTSIVPEQPLVAGQRYRVVANPLNGENLDPAKDFDTSEFKASAALEIPATAILGALRLKSGIKRERLSILDGGGAVEFPAVFQDIELVVSPELAPWRSALVYETLVDGVTWNEPEPVCSHRLGSSWMGRGVDRVFASCGTPEENKFVRSGVALGEHSLQLRARLVGSAQVYLSNEVKVKFDCQPDASSDTGSSSTSEGATATSSGASTGGSSGSDGTHTSEGATQGTTGTSSGSQGSPSVTCSVSGTGAFTWSLGVLAILGMGLFCRGRR